MAPTAASDRADNALATTGYVWNVLREKIGLGGAGAAPTLADVDDVTVAAGFYYVTASAAGTPLANSGLVLHKVYGTAGFQLFQPYGVERIFYRRRNGTWQAWQEFSTTASVQATLQGAGLASATTGSVPADADALANLKSGMYYLPGPVSPYPNTNAFVIRLTYNGSRGFELMNAPYTDRFWGRSSNSDGSWRTPVELAKVDSQALTGVPTAPTAAVGTNTTQLATTAFVSAAVANLVASAPASLDTLRELAAALGNDPNFATTMTNALAGKAGKATTLGGYGITDGAGKEGAAVALGHDGATAYVRRTDGGVHYVQTYLGFTPVRQGGGNGQGGNIVYLGWDLAGAGLRAQVDALDLGLVWTDRDAAIKALAATINTGAGGFASYGFFRNIAGTILGPGSTVAGSALSWSGGDDNQTSNSSPGGTWRLMGWTQGRSSNGAANSLYQRIA
ncbi:hypothetical protein N5C93_04475 [Pseudomonas nitroreducens]|nr:hypothetical protein [Pseudomonas nitroreducens]MDH1072082.1 hypothetical protein [Pseudomonas nitroreducens]